MNYQRCSGCGRVFKGPRIAFCPFCGHVLNFIGQVIGGRCLEDDLENGWKLVLWKLTTPRLNR